MLRCYLTILAVLTINLCSAQILAMLRDSAKYYYKKGDYQKSIVCLEKYLVESPGSEDALILKSKALLSAGQREEALATLNYLIRVTPQPGAGAYLQRGTVFLELQRYDSAIIDLSKTLAITDRYDSIVYPMRAHLLFYTHDYRRAYDDLEVVLKRSPGDDDALKMRVFALLAIEELDKCIHLCYEYLAKKPGDSAVLFIRGQASLQKKQFELAIRDFNACAKADARQERLHFFRGMANYYLAHDEEAIADLTKALTESPQDGHIYMLLADCKNNLKPGSGCDDWRTALKLGIPGAQKALDQKCK